MIYWHGSRKHLLALEDDRMPDRIPGDRLSTPIERRPIRAAVAEDDEDIRSLIACALRHDGIAVTEAASGSALIELVAKRVLKKRRLRAPFDLIVSDVRMPGPDGLEILGALRHAGWWTPVILITAFADEHVHAEAYRLGAVAVFDKPFELDALRLLARAIVD